MYLNQYNKNQIISKPLFNENAIKDPKHVAYMVQLK